MVRFVCKSCGKNFQKRIARDSHFKDKHELHIVKLSGSNVSKGSKKKDGRLTLKQYIIFAGVGIFLIVSLLNFHTSSNINPDLLSLEKTSDLVSVEFVAVPASGSLVDGVRVIDVEVFQFGWSPNEIVVNQGERIRLSVTSRDIPHGLFISRLNFDVGSSNTQITKFNPVNYEFDASETGTWTMMCSVYCGAGHNSMQGKLIVK